MLFKLGHLLHIKRDEDLGNVSVFSPLSRTGSHAGKNRCNGGQLSSSAVFKRLSLLRKDCMAFMSTQVR